MSELPLCKAVIFGVEKTPMCQLVNPPPRRLLRNLVANTHPLRLFAISYQESATIGGLSRISGTELT